MAGSVKVKWIGEAGLEEYHGHDGTQSVDIAQGQIVEVSAEKAAQLKEDFPHLVSIGGKPAEEKAGPKPLAELTKAELDKIAADEGVEDFPSGRRAKVEAKVAAIEAHRASATPVEPEPDAQ